MYLASNESSASAFYGFTPILIPQSHSPELLAQLLSETKADGLIATAGRVSSRDLGASAKQMKCAIWVVEQTSRQMDFVQNPMIGKSTSEWHTLVDQDQATSTEFPSPVSSNGMPDIISIWPTKDSDNYEILQYTQKVCITGHF